MNFIKYAPLAMRTAKVFPFSKQCDHAAIGMIGELGELADALKRVTIYGKSADTINFKEEIGDFVWYWNLLLDTLQINPKIFQRSLEEHAECSEHTPMNLDRSARAIFTLNSFVAHVAASGFWPEEGVEVDVSFIATYHDVFIEQVLDQMACMLLHMCRMLGVTLEEAFDANIAKLAARYGDKYSDHAALNRDLKVERDVLEGAATGGIVTQGQNSDHAAVVTTGVSGTPGPELIDIVRREVSAHHAHIKP